MEGVGARLGRSSSRYSGPAVVFSGPVRKWKKKWIDVPSTNSNKNIHHNHNSSSTSTASSHLQLYKWTPVAPPIANGTASSPSTPVPNGTEPEEPARRRVRYVPISVDDEEKQEIVAKADDESKDGDTDVVAHNDNSNSEADVNDVTMQDDDTDNTSFDDDASRTHIDLNLGLKGQDGRHENDQTEDGDARNTHSEIQNRGKRKNPNLEMGL